MPSLITKILNELDMRATAPKSIGAGLLRAASSMSMSKPRDLLEADLYDLFMGAIDSATSLRRDKDTLGLEQQIAVTSDARKAIQHQIDKIEKSIRLDEQTYTEADKKDREQFVRDLVNNCLKPENLSITIGIVRVIRDVIDNNLNAREAKKESEMQPIHVAIMPTIKELDRKVRENPRHTESNKQLTQQLKQLTEKYIQTSLDPIDKRRVFLWNSEMHLEDAERPKPSHNRPR